MCITGDYGSDTRMMLKQQIACSTAALLYLLCIFHFSHYRFSFIHTTLHRILKHTVLKHTDLLQHSVIYSNACTHIIFPAVFILFHLTSLLRMFQTNYRQSGCDFDFSQRGCLRDVRLALALQNQSNCIFYSLRIFQPDFSTHARKKQLFERIGLSQFRMLIYYAMHFILKEFKRLISNDISFNIFPVD